MKKILLLTFTSISLLVSAQFQIGHRTITYADPSRTGGFGSGGGTGRQIQCEVYYPASTSGENSPVAAGSFPVITFGHGFVMAWDAYENIWEHYAPLGYILIFPRTEGGFSPTHLEFGKDLAYVTNQFITKTTISTEPFYNHYNNRSAIIGHSMGGGSSVLAAAQSTAPFNVLVGMAPAETNPEASLAATSVDIPALIFSGSGDAVTPAADHHTPIFTGLNSSCKQFISITGGAHCYFANSNFNCDLGEGTSGGDITIDRAEQHDIVFEILDSYLDFYLKLNATSWTAYLADIQDTRVVETNNCTVNPLGIDESESAFDVSPNPVEDALEIRSNTIEPMKIFVFTANGEIVTESIMQGSGTIDFKDKKQGVYFIKVGNSIQRVVRL
jgi:dienelactone hydrolase